MKDHELIEELISARALGGLEVTDEETLARAMAAHGEACADCRRLEREYAEVASRLAFALDPVPVSPELEDRVMAAAVSGRARPQPSAEIEPRDARGWRLRPLVAVAAAIVLFVAGVVVGSRAIGGDSGVPEGARVVAFEGETGANLAVAFGPDGEGIYLLGSGLAALPGDRVYEVWLFQDGTPVPTTCFAPSEDGSVFAFVDANVGTSEAMAVTVEPSTCPSAPTTAPILTAQIAV